MKLLGRISLAVAIVGVFTGVSSAQTTTSNLNWNMPLQGSQALSDVQGFTYLMKVDTAAPVILTATCTGATLPVCAAPIANLTTGPHTLTLTAQDAMGSASTSISGQPPSTPTGFTITIIVKVP